MAWKMVMTATIMAVLLSAARTGSITTGLPGAAMDMAIEDLPPICC
jgi:hypothetical protein